MRVNAYLSFDGRCEAAFKFYEKCLGGKIAFMQTHGDSPMAEDVPPAWRSKIVHATLMDDQLRTGGLTPSSRRGSPTKEGSDVR